MKGLGDNATAAMLRAAADKLSALVRSKLYVGGDAGGFWACEQPDGRLVQVRSVPPGHNINYYRARPSSAAGEHMHFRSRQLLDPWHASCSPFVVAPVSGTFSSHARGRGR